MRGEDLQKLRSSVVIASIVFCILAVFHGQLNYAQPRSTDRLDELRPEWVGQYPHKGKVFFLNEPKIKDRLQQMLGQSRFEALVAGKYLEEPIDYVAGYYVLNFAANPHLMTTEEWVYIAVREHTGSMHIAIKDSQYRVMWKHSAEADIPPRLLMMLDLWDEKR